ncbi:MAG TPA: hypothetical protein DCL95_19835 [Rhodospirillaceae bacterium]|nr:hypothetical protein [Rhodospirillaceae bacterium]MAX61149.1 hypothetical protein [Rhodospirillaceae bacterium]MBB55892.1 hypothetical protein [Rhodospirillaceae bacterium]HAE02548.1 hypothetical protein [Rhodospirillaceae bacterium]HAJ22273.1 hypothetical protein [Rhodospirillaceae bacterium]
MVRYPNEPSCSRSGLQIIYFINSGRAELNSLHCPMTCACYGNAGSINLCYDSVQTVPFLRLQSSETVGALEFAIKNNYLPSGNDTGVV